MNNGEVVTDSVEYNHFEHIALPVGADVEHAIRALPHDLHRIANRVQDVRITDAVLTGRFIDRQVRRRTSQLSSWEIDARPDSQPP